MAHKTYKGKYIPNNPHKYSGDVNKIIFRSLWERKLMKWCDNNPRVLKWVSEECPVHYYSKVDRKMRRYFVDFYIMFQNADGSIKRVMVEVKPHKQTIPPKMARTETKKSKARYLYDSLTYQRNQDKWSAARKFATKHGMEFRIMDEYALGIKKRKISNGKI